MRAKRVVRARLSPDELQEIADYSQDLIDHGHCDPTVVDADKVGVQTLLDTTRKELAERPKLVDGVAFLFMEGNLWKHDLSEAWHATKLLPLEDGRLYAASDVYAQNGRAQIDIVRVRA